MLLENIFSKENKIILNALILFSVVFVIYASPPPLAIIERDDLVITEGDEDGNGIIESGKVCSFRVALNSSTYSFNEIYDVSARVTTGNPKVNIIDSIANYGDLATGGVSGPANDNFKFDTEHGLNGDIVFELYISYKDSQGIEYSLVEPFNITIGVEKINHPPVFNDIGVQSVEEGSVLEFNVSATDIDGDSLSYLAVNLPNGSIFDKPSGKFNWVPSGTQSGVYVPRFIVTDGEAQDKMDVIINVINVNAAPAFDPVGDMEVDELKTLTFYVSASDSDGDDLTYSALDLPDGAIFTGAFKKFTWTPAGNQSGTYTVNFTVTDGYLTDSIEVNITVNNLNHPPVLGYIG
ncbi:MAG: putative Ig domain-containing protein, partial [Candidatus Omnitrophota bacterium]